MEVDEGLGKHVIVLENTEPVAFDEFRQILERIAADLHMAKEASPLFAD